MSTTEAFLSEHSGCEDKFRMAANLNRDPDLHNDVALTIVPLPGRRPHPAGTTS
ncbi:hypothetical protein [Singulisphaera sp. GP187]|uniref:hypothetical protein n=1 Tax=Singulisphaera sp. GP187 TaxID=1882752 RepID=UPI0013565FD0|nr:hypothetical protein [Singulisphaera sp. GP187]